MSIKVSKERPDYLILINGNYHPISPKLGQILLEMKMIAPCSDKGHYNVFKINNHA